MLEVFLGIYLIGLFIAVAYFIYIIIKLDDNETKGHN